MPKVETYVGKKATTYRVRGRDNFGRTTTETFTTKKAAETFCKLVDAVGFVKACEDRARRDAASDTYVPTVAEVLAEHIKHLTGVEERTRKDYASMGKRTFLKHLGDRRVDMVESDDVKDFVNALEESGSAPKSIKNAHGLLSSVFAYAMAKRYIDWNPCYKVALPKRKRYEQRLERFLTHEEYERLIEHIPAPYVPLVMTLFGTGLRWSEATALTVADYAPAQAPTVHNTLGMPPTLRVIKAWKRTPKSEDGTRGGWHVGRPKSEKSNRTVMLPGQVAAALEPLVEGRSRADLLFTAYDLRFTRSPRPQGGVIYHGWFRSRVWVPACIAAGLATPRPDRKTDPKGWKAWKYDGPRIHDARHTHASWLLEQPLVTLEMVQDQLGHEDIQTTRKVYGHLQPVMRNALAAAATRAMMATTSVLEAPAPVAAIGA